jgi:hypothetical protein
MIRDPWSNPNDGHVGRAAREPERDPRLGRAIRDAEGSPPSRARLELLRSRIAMAAAAALDARRDCAWWEWMTRWARAEVAFAAAATILALAAGHITSAWPGGAAGAAIAESGARGRSLGIGPLDSVLARSLAAGATSEQVMNALVGPVSQEWMFTAAVAR